MKKNSGFVLAETLVVTTFVAGVLIFLFVQFTSLSKNYEDAYKYNPVEGLYSARTIKDYIKSDFANIETKINDSDIVDLKDCSLFTEKKYCLKLFELENIEKIFLVKNKFDKDIFVGYDNTFKKFINKIQPEGEEKYRLLVEFSNSSYATIRFGD